MQRKPSGRRPPVQRQPAVGNRIPAPRKLSRPEMRRPAPRQLRRHQGR